MCCGFEGVSVPKDKREVHGVFSKIKRTTRVTELDATLSGWSGAEDVSFSATPVSPEMMQLGRQLASTVEERTARQIQTGLLFVCYWPSGDGV